jgi:hypothetical protein
MSADSASREQQFKGLGVFLEPGMRCCKKRESYKGKHKSAAQVRSVPLASDKAYPGHLPGNLRSCKVAN